MNKFVYVFTLCFVGSSTFGLLFDLFVRPYFGHSSNLELSFYSLTQFLFSTFFGSLVVASLAAWYGGYLPSIM